MRNKFAKKLYRKIEEFFSGQISEIELRKFHQKMKKIVSENELLGGGNGGGGEINWIKQLENFFRSNFLRGKFVKKLYWKIEKNFFSAIFRGKMKKILSKNETILTNGKNYFWVNFRKNIKKIWSKNEENLTGNWE